ncbi:hypothetical protein ACFXDJ_15465 [Streptomyces sp. NPDC059443]|uniref:hypothetical protein n=1 Tax=unclassified Streptomyces TaxID=2593676 RepID=UPI00369CBECA
MYDKTVPGTVPVVDVLRPQRVDFGIDTLGQWCIEVRAEDSTLLDWLPRPLLASRRVGHSGAVRNKDGSGTRYGSLTPSWTGTSWNGHCVLVLPDSEWIVDATLEQFEAAAGRSPAAADHLGRLPRSQAAGRSSERAGNGRSGRDDRG